MTERPTIVMTSEHQDILDQLQREHDKYAAITAELAQVIASLERIVPHLPSATSEVSVPDMRQPLGGWRRWLDGLTQFEAIVKIAEANGGIIRSTTVRDIFVRAGFARGTPRNINGHIHQLLRKSTDFEKVKPGVFRLVTPDLPPRICASAQQKGR